MDTSYLDDHLVQAIATIMERRIQARGIEVVGERKDLEPSTVAVLGAAFPDRVEKERKVAIPDRKRVGNADIIVRTEPGSSALSALVELKWAGPGDDILYEAIYDLFKLALATQRKDRPRTYLLTGAAKAHWEGSVFADLFMRWSAAPAPGESTSLCFTGDVIRRLLTTGSSRQSAADPGDGGHRRS
jgi:hypothetical protein